ncbi:MAG: glycosyltransferase family 4 protein [Henriciella sp.]|nr:glycosyltransferase family 4 protein [Henriciella sp.]
MSKLERIVIIHDSNDARGGATGLARLSAQQYRAMGYDVVFITGATDDGSLNSAGVETVGMNQKKLLAQGKMEALINGMHNRRAASIVSDWISQNDSPQTGYHLHNWAQALSPSIFSALEPVAARTIVSCHDYFNICPNGGLLDYKSSQPCTLKPMSSACWLSQCDRRSSLQKYWRMLRQINLNRLAQFRQSKMTFVTLHEGMSDLMRSIGFGARSLTSNPNPATAWTDQRVACEANESFLYVGRLERDKGADIAVQGAKNAGVPITLVGEGGLEHELKATYHAARFAGFCDKAEIGKIAQKARALIVPSRVPEPYGLVVAEAALSGIPVLIAQHCLLSKSICDRDMGDSFDPNQLDTLKQRIAMWASDDDLIKSMSENARAHASVICSTPDQWINRFIAILQQKLQAKDSKEGERT